MFLSEVTKKCLEVTKKEKEVTPSYPEYRKRLAVSIPQYVTYSNYNHGQFTPSQNILVKRIDNQALPVTNSASSLTTTVTGNSTSSDTSTRTTDVPTL